MTTILAHFAIVAVIIFSVGCSSAAGESPFRISTKRNTDKVEVTLEKDEAVIFVRSPFGISQAVIERNGKNWPSTVMLRLHLKGLENFKVTNGQVTVEAAVSRQDEIRLWKDGKEDALLDAKSPCWMEIRMIGKDGKPVEAIPLKDGYFEMRLPKALFEDNPSSITLNWIDFYR